MRKNTFRFLITIFIGIGLSISTFGQDLEKKNAIKFNPFSFIGGMDMLSYERAVSSHSTIVVGGGPGIKWLGDVSYNYWGASLQYRYYLSGVFEDGSFYGLLRSGFQTGDGKYESGNTTIDNINFNSYGFGLGIGYIKIFGKNQNWIFDLNVAAGYTLINYEDENISDTYTGIKDEGFIPAGAIGIGYIF